MSCICVYLGAREGHDARFREAAVTLGRCIAERGDTLVYGGAQVGLMGALADATLAAGGQVIGVIPHHLVDRELAHESLTRLIRVDDMHERKATMAEHADAFIALPGGIGTLEELFETWTWQYLGLHDKPLGVLDVGGFYQPLLRFLDSTVEAGLLDATTRGQLVAAAEPNVLLDRLMAPADAD
ncbi:MULTISPECIES: TIGR00730 family Rossman fold protein [unclassified Modicisalibacter]|uniref:LOG family protein n=1 Tax=unclassified Modicisalibacter TaxID=2679913 RepID=UPI001CD0232C|nr:MULTISPECIES: TIGR00730 family Rossman fold protein [unclassified Modicisalibacter]MBZ9558241.1 TIGR00730 family Rossman fold protein [Modicisalibacter sp. R2A 31.J]MBZ9573091.1 TIGR00730 family Rossman fold protein [Modicisalibacter sp. MOD 31.J]